MISFADYMHALINEINPVSITDQTRTQMKSHPKYYIISLILKCINKYIPEYYVFWTWKLVLVYTVITAWGLINYVGVNSHWVVEV